MKTRISFYLIIFILFNPFAEGQFVVKPPYFTLDPQRLGTPKEDVIKINVEDDSRYGYYNRRPYLHDYFKVYISKSPDFKVEVDSLPFYGTLEVPKHYLQGVISGLDPMTKYYVKIKGKKGSFWSDFSDIEEVITRGAVDPPSELLAVEDVTIQVTSPLSAKVAFNDQQRYDYSFYYDAYLKNSQGSTIAYDKCRGCSNFSFHEFNGRLNPGMQCALTIIKRTEDNIKLLSSEYLITMDTFPVPQPEFQITNITGNTFTVDWTRQYHPLPYPYQYRIEKSKQFKVFISGSPEFSSYVSGAHLNLYGSYQESANIYGLQQGTDYYVKMVSKNDFGDWSDTTEVRTVRTIPGCPVLIDPNELTLNSFHARWQPVSGATHYEVDVATDLGFTSFITGYQGAQSTTDFLEVTVPDPVPPFLLYRVRACTSGGCSDYSAFRRIDLNVSPPIITNTYYPSWYGFEVSWDDAESSKEVVADVSLNPEFTDLVYDNFVIWRRSNPVRRYYFRDNILSGREYYVRLRARNYGGPSLNIFNGTTKNSEVLMVKTAPKFPNNIQPFDITGTSAKIRWDFSVGADYYFVQVYEASSGFGLNETVTGNEVTFIGLNPNKYYTLRVSAWNSTGGSYAAFGPTFRTSNAGSRIASEPALILKPDPKDLIPQEKTLKFVRVFDLQGRGLGSFDLTDGSLDYMRKLPANQLLILYEEYVDGSVKAKKIFRK
ncbi:MAG: fibronectin type III domain-containing protein [Cyclobacteriaceae bacterium]|nr:fibronectin type III domain-containing protein [Cyclobacteriaceae bacterium HetDA_MAG_MS6]